MQIPIDLFQTLVPEIDPQAAHERAKENALFVDVREWNEILQAAYDVPNVVILPMSEFEARYNELPTDRDLIIVCRGGGRSLRATEFLLQRGYQRVVNLRGGILRWYAEGLPTKGNPN